MTRNIIGIAIVALVVGFAVTAVQAESIPTVITFTDDAGSQISHLKAYTHAYDMGQSTSTPAVVDGVQFKLITDGVGDPLVIEDTNFRMETFPVEGNTTGFNWTEFDSDHGIKSGQAVNQLMRDFLVPYQKHYYQVLTLSGLTPGTKYDVRMYYRRWPNSATRNVTVDFDHNGDGTYDDTSGVINGDAGGGLYSSFLSYQYTAAASGTLNIKFTQASQTSAWIHCGLTNEVVVPEPSTIALLGCALVGLLAYAWRKQK